MEIVTLVLAVIGLFAIVLAVLMKMGIIKDKNSNMIPDELEQLISEIKTRTQAVKLELEDVKNSLSDLKKQLGDIDNAVKGGRRRK